MQCTARECAVTSDAREARSAAAPTPRHTQHRTASRTGSTACSGAWSCSAAGRAESPRRPRQRASQSSSWNSLQPRGRRLAWVTLRHARRKAARRLRCSRAPPVRPPRLPDGLYLLLRAPRPSSALCGGSLPKQVRQPARPGSPQGPATPGGARGQRRARWRGQWQAARLAQVLARLLERLAVELAQLLQARVVALVAADVEQRRADAHRQAQHRARHAHLPRGRPVGHTGGRPLHARHSTVCHAQVLTGSGRRPSESGKARALQRGRVLPSARRGRSHHCRRRCPLGLAVLKCKHSRRPRSPGTAARPGSLTSVSGSDQSSDRPARGAGSRVLCCARGGCAVKAQGARGAAACLQQQG